MIKEYSRELPEFASPFKFLILSSRPYRKFAYGAFFLMGISTLGGTATAYVFKLIVESAQSLGQAGGATTLWYATSAYVGLSLLRVATRRGAARLDMYWETGIRAVSHQTLSAYVLQHSTAYFSDRFGGSISSKMGQAARSLMAIGNALLWNFLPFVITIVSSFALAFYTSPLIASIFFAWVVLLVPLNIWLVRRGLHLSREAQRAENILGGVTVDLLTNILAVFEFVQRKNEVAHLGSKVHERREAGLRNWRYRENIRLFNSILQVIFIGAIILMTAHLAIQGTLSAGDVVMVLTIIILVQDQLTFIGNQFDQFGKAWGEVEEGLHDIVLPYEVIDHPNASPLSEVKGTILFQNVSFTYGGERVFHNLTFSIPHGQRVGIVGKSGAGKSTLVKILLRHYDLTEGTVRIDGTNIADVTKESLRKAIAVVPQEPLLFHRSIRDNIAYGDPEASFEDVRKAAKRAQADSFIERLPEGYEALVGERGIKLSGGQRQRVAIARAMLKDAPILLLDEATSALDSESEVAVQKALLSLMENRTVIAVAHRLSTLRAMDRLIIMDDGEIIEDGTHDALVAKGGLYAELWSHQAGGFLDA